MSKIYVLRRTNTKRINNSVYLFDSFEKAVEEMEIQYNDLINTCNDMSTDNERFIIFDKRIHKSEGSAMVTTNDKIEEMWHIELKEVR